MAVSIQKADTTACLALENETPPVPEEPYPPETLASSPSSDAVGSSSSSVNVGSSSLGVSSRVQLLTVFAIN